MKVKRQQIGWYLWLQWVAATVVALAFAAEGVRRLLPAIFGLNAITVMVTGLMVISMVGIAQGLVLRRYGVPLGDWTLATLLGSALIIALAVTTTLFPQPNAVHWHHADGSVQIWEGTASGNTGFLLALWDGAPGFGSTAIGGAVAIGSLGSGVFMGDFDSFPGILLIWLLSGLGSIAVGFAQRLVLRHYAYGVEWWIPATLLGRVAGGVSTIIMLSIMGTLVTSLEVPILVSLAGMGVYSAVQAAITGIVLMQGMRKSLTPDQNAP